GQRALCPCALDGRNGAARLAAVEVLVPAAHVLPAVLTPRRGSRRRAPLCKHQAPKHGAAAIAGQWRTMTQNITPTHKPQASTHDTTRIDDLRIKAVRPLITPALLQEWLPTPQDA